MRPQLLNSFTCFFFLYFQLYSWLQFHLCVWSDVKLLWIFWGDTNKWTIYDIQVYVSNVTSTSTKFEHPYPAATPAANCYEWNSYNTFISCVLWHSFASFRFFLFVYLFGTGDVTIVYDYCHFICLLAWKRKIAIFVCVVVCATNKCRFNKIKKKKMKTVNQ